MVQRSDAGLASLHRLTGRHDPRPAQPCARAEKFAQRGALATLHCGGGGEKWRDTFRENKQGQKNAVQAGKDLPDIDAPRQSPEDPDDNQNNPGHTDEHGNVYEKGPLAFVIVQVAQNTNDSPKETEGCMGQRQRGHDLNSRRE